jgi:hypothetical protein
MSDFINRLITLAVIISLGWIIYSKLILKQKSFNFKNLLGGEGKLLKKDDEYVR